MELDTGLFVKAATDCEAICNAIPFELGDGSGVGMPIFNESDICFNGSKNSRHFANSRASIHRSDGLQLSNRQVSPCGDGSFETFAVPRYREADELRKHGLYFDFCKTGRRPCDLNVQACLVILSHYFGDDVFRVESDGSEVEWNEARQACHAVLGYGLEFQFQSEI